VLFTAAEQTYADLVLEHLDPERAFFAHRFYRHHCFHLHAAGFYLKDLRILGDRPLEDTLIVDNSILSFSAQLDNGVPICSFTGNPNDRELAYLMTYLEEIFH
jgi:CTD small phosphatase-like protein 2